MPSISPPVIWSKPQYRVAANKAMARVPSRPLLHRLCGFETEYVARFIPDAPAGDAEQRTTTYSLLFRLADELKRRVPVVPAKYAKKGFFLATGGAVWHERPGEGFDHPLIEG